MEKTAKIIIPKLKIQGQSIKAERSNKSKNLTENRPRPSETLYHNLFTFSEKSD